MFGLATSAKQDQLMATIKDLTAAIQANTAATQKLVALVPPAATELTQLRADLAATAPAIDAAVAALTGQQPALDEATTTLTGAVANQGATTGG